MKYLLKLEALGLLALFTSIYAVHFPGNWGTYFALFFIPDIAFAFYWASKKLGTAAYNLLHHQGFLAIVLMIGVSLHQDLLTQVALIFLSHSTFDRIAGYGLKHFDSFDHTHLGWIGKSKHRNQE